MSCDNQQNSLQWQSSLGLDQSALSFTGSFWGLLQSGFVEVVPGVSLSSSSSSSSSDSSGQVITLTTFTPAYFINTQVGVVGGNSGLILGNSGLDYSGTWVGVLDSGDESTSWSMVTLTAIIPTYSSVVISVAGGNSDSVFPPYISVLSGVGFTPIVGRYFSIVLAMYRGVLPVSASPVVEKIAIEYHS